jgi:hypothetical protein
MSKSFRGGEEERMVWKLPSWAAGKMSGEQYRDFKSKEWSDYLFCQDFHRYRRARINAVKDVIDDLCF